jgi:tetratricopeptide (TPR) repeat protein/predicted Ser/Thr protein kinase/TolB-like protein
MLCTHCQTPVPDGAAACPVCHDSLEKSGGTPALPAAGLTSSPTVTPAPRPSGSSVASFSGPSTLPEGFEIGRRYRVVKLLGRGGMGAVYKCHDEELQREVALKIIRPEIASDTGIIERFKREIQLSSRVTHKNVLRVYDLGEADGVRFLTMQFVEGEDLAGLLRRTGPLPVTRLFHVFRQICEGLAAAHEEGVVHRDLKPQNVLLDAEDHVWLTDFGLAKSLGGSAMTELGAVMGTPSYMSPEQVRGQAVDKRSDIYSLGIVFYEMATGRTPFGGGSMYEVMMRRLSTPPRPVTELNPAVPPYLAKVLARCLEVDPRSRFQSVGEILTDLDAAVFLTTVRYEVHRRRRLLAALGLALALALSAAGVSWLVKRKPAPSRAPEQARSVLIADFENRTGDPVFDGTLETAFNIALEDASFITSYRRDSARKVAAQLQPGTTGLPENVARLVAAREGVGVVTSGSVAVEGAGYKVTVRAVDAMTGKPILSAGATADGKKEVLGVVGKLASKVRGALGDTKSESERLAAAETFTAGSLEASHEYAVAQDFQSAGRFDEAVAHYQKAVELDPDMGRAYSGLAAIYQNHGRHADAKKCAEDAIRRLERMSEREKFRTRGLYYLITRRPDKAAEEFSALVKQYPADTAGYANLALAYFYAHDTPAALRAGHRAIDMYPKNVPQRNNVGLYAMYGSDFETAVKEQQIVLELNPKFHLAFVGLALSQLGIGKPDDARATWQRVAALDARGASLAAMGLADMALAAGKPTEAVPLLEKGAADDLAAKDPDAAASKLVALAEAQLALGKEKEAIAWAEKAVSLAKGENILFPAAGVFLATGKPQRALALATDLGKSLEDDPRAYGKLIEAEAQLKAGKAAEAIRMIEAAKALADTWIGRFLDGRAYVEAGAFAEAEAELERCMKRRGEATAAFGDEMPSWRLYAPVLYWRGRAQAGLKSPAAAETFKAFLALRPDAGGDPLVADARRRSGAK